MLKIMIMIMMMMTLMKLVNSRTKIRPGIDKFYQPNSGLCSSRRWDEAIYTHTYLYTYVNTSICIYYIYTCFFLCLLFSMIRTFVWKYSFFS